MADTTQRLLTLLNLLQSRPVWTGPELADRLGVTTRSIRRDVDRLRDLGYPVNATQGVGGGYQLGRGKALPPLLLDDDEAIATAVALRLAALGAVAGASEAALRTLTKLDQVMPPRLRAEVAAIQHSVDILEVGGQEVDPDLLLGLAQAARDLLRIEFRYARPDRNGSFNELVVSRRRVEPYRLVAAGQRWYLMAYDLDRDDWRTFRLDRIAELVVGTWRFTVREHPDPVEYVSQSLRAGYDQSVRVLMRAPLEEIARQLPRQVAVTDRGDGTVLLQFGSNSLYRTAFHLSSLGYEFEVLEPTELVGLLADLGRRMVSAAAAAHPDR